MYLWAILCSLPLKGMLVKRCFLNCLLYSTQDTVFKNQIPKFKCIICRHIYYLPILIMNMPINRHKEPWVAYCSPHSLQHFKTHFQQNGVKHHLLFNDVRYSYFQFQQCITLNSSIYLDLAPSQLYFELLFTQKLIFNQFTM